jgi:Deoxynucleotide monophosphate kinase
MIIGLSGEKESGKDTVAAYLVKRYEFERKAFADPLKRSVATLFNIPFKDVDALKNDKRAMVTLKTYPGYSVEMSFRGFLQRYGTESHRDTFGEDFWVDITLPAGGYYPGRNIVITDVRFPNEAERVKSVGGSLVRIYRSMALTKDTHPSEQFAFEVDHIIYNNGTLDQLWPKVEDMLVEMSSYDTA